MRRKLVIFVTVCVLGGIYYSYRLNSVVPPAALPAPISSPEATPVSSPLPPSPSPAPSPSLVKVKILDTADWIGYECGPIGYRIPADLTVRCSAGNEGTFDITVTKEGEYGTRANIFVRNYDGGSRRQYWIRTMQASASELKTYVKFQESLFGSVSGLDVFASGGWWQGGYSSPILIAKGNTIVSIYGGRNYLDQDGGKIIRWDFTDTIASTIRFLD